VSDNSAAAQLRRILHVIPRLADGEEHALADIAASVGTTGPSLLKDLEALVERYDVPGGFVEGVQLFVTPETVSVLSNHFQRPMRLTIAELCALELGLAMLRNERPPDERPPIDRALGRLREVITRLPSNAAHEGVRSAGTERVANVGHLATIRGALRARRKVRLAYRRGDDEAATERVVCTYGLAFAHGAWYAVAFCEMREALRFFRLDRVDAAEALDARYEVPPAFRLDDVVAGGKMFMAERPRTMTVRYSPRVARWIAEREGKTVEPDGSLTLEHPLAVLDWAVRHVLQYGPEVTVLEPDEVRQAVVSRLERMSAS
jgi:proteasome accessory factor C